MDGKPNAVVCTCRPANKPKGKVLWGCANCVELCGFSTVDFSIALVFPACDLRRQVVLAGSNSSVPTASEGENSIALMRL